MARRPKRTFQQKGKYPIKVKQTGVEGSTKRIEVLIPDTATLQEARDEMELYVDPAPGTFCPCCRRVAANYVRELSADAAALIIWLTINYQHNKRWYHKNDIEKDGWVFRGGDYAKAVFWGLIELQDQTAAGMIIDNTRTSGCWKPTGRGQAFARGLLKVPRKIKLSYQGRFLGYDDPGDLIDIQEALKNKHSYMKLMNIRPMDLAHAI